MLFEGFGGRFFRFRRELFLSRSNAFYKNQDQAPFIFFAEVNFKKLTPTLQKIKKHSTPITQPLPNDPVIGEVMVLGLFVTFETLKRLFLTQNP